MSKLKIVYKHVDEIIPYVNNPRKISQNAIDKVASSIKNFGFKVPIIIDKDNEIVAGHNRILAAKKLGMEEVPCIVADDLTEAQVKAFRIADNKTGELAEWDFELLSLELEELEELNFNLELTGFETNELEDILNMRDEEIEIIEDDYIVEEKITPYTRLGDIWHLGRHILYIADSTKKENYETLLNGKKVDLVITDPPYNANYEGKTKDKLKIKNDSMEDEEFYKFLLKAFDNLYDFIIDGGPIYIFYSELSAEEFLKAFKTAGFKLSQILIWVKNHFTFGRFDYHWRHEHIIYGWKEGAPHKWYGGRKEDTVLEDMPDIENMKKEELKDLVKELLENAVETTIIYENRPMASEIHPTMKPIKLISRLIKNSSIKEDLILDIFGGSGSTLMAAEQLGRICYTMELDEVYSQNIIERYILFKRSFKDVYLERDGRKIKYEEIGDINILEKI